MDEHQRGNLFLEKIPDRGVEKKVISYLVNLRQGSSPEVISAKVKKAPFVLFKDISAQRALMIAGDLRQLGAKATFIPVKSDRQKADRDKGPSRSRTSFADSLNSKGSKKSRATPATKAKSKKRGRLVFLLILLAVSLVFLVWQNVTFFSTVYDHYFLITENPKSKQTPRQDHKNNGLDKEKTSLIIEVPSPEKVDSKDLYNPGK